MYVCMYVYVYNPHLGLINAPHPYVFLPQNDLFHCSFTINKARNRCICMYVCIYIYIYM